jgi:DNA-binding CsgD family transcriptional regulator
VREPVSPLLSDVLRMAAPAQPEYRGRGVRVMTAPATVTGRDLRALAAIVSQDRPDLPDGEGLPPSLLADLKDQIRCDDISLDRSDSGQQGYSIVQSVPALSHDELKAFENLDPALWEHWWACRWDCQSNTYPERTGDLRSVVKPSDFYSARQWHSTGMYSDYHRPYGIEHELQLCLHDSAELSAGPERHVRLYLYRGTGPDFSERDRAVLTLLRPHLRQAYLEAERRRDPVPRLTPRQWELLRLLAAGHTNTQIGRRLGVTEGTVRTHLENIYERLHVSSRTAAAARAFPAGPPRA